VKIASAIKWVIAALSFIWCAIEAMGNGDFFIYCYAAEMLRDGNDIYTRTFLNGFHYYYSLSFALLLKPFLTLPFYGVKMGWLIINLTAYFHLFYLAITSKYVRALTVSRQKMMTVLLFLSSFRVLYDNIHTSQITLVLLWLSVYGTMCSIRGQAVKGGLLLAIGVNIKLLPLVIIPYLVYRGYFKAVLVCLFGVIALLVLPGLFIGMDYNFFLLARWWELVNPAGTQHVLDTDERSFHGLTTLLSTLLVEKVPDVYALPLKRNIADVSIDTLSKIIGLVRLTLVAFTLYFLRWTPFKKASGSKTLFEMSYLLMVVPLIFPHQQAYGFIFMAPAMGCILWVLLKHSTTRHSFVFVKWCYGLVFLLFSLKILLGEFNHYYEHYKILTYGAILLIPLLVWAYRQEVLLPQTKSSD
jgi:hypothetical protein